MTGRTIDETITAFQEAVRDVWMCISDEGIFVRKRANPGDAGFVYVLGHRPAKVQLHRRGSSSLVFYMAHDFVVNQDAGGLWRAHTTQYIHELSDAGGQRILAYHYHPRGRGTDTYPSPHLHVYAPVLSAERRLEKLHLPTNRVGLEDVASLLIEGYGVTVREPYARDDRWRDILESARGMLRDELGLA